MQTLRCFLMVWEEGRDWQISIHRELEDLVATWNTHVHSPDATGVIHVGFSRPDTRSLMSCAAAHKGRVILTGSARFSLGGLGRCLPEPVGDVDGIPLFLSCEGWGYTIQADLGAQTLDGPQASTFSIEDSESESGSEREWLLHLESQTTPHLIRRRRTWLKDALAQAPELGAVVSNVAILDDLSYVKNEARLPDVYRVALGAQRFEYLVTGLHDADAGTLARCMPPWFIQTSVSALGLGVRAGNCMREADISTVSDLRFFVAEALLKLPKFGRKSSTELAEKLRTCFDAEVKLRLSDSTEQSTSLESCSLESTQPTRARNNTAVRFLHEVEEILIQLRRGRDVVLGRRMGVQADPATLQEIADEIGVTRERVRQIERASKLEIQHLTIWKVLESHLSTALSTALEPLPVLGLEVVHPWFEGIGAKAKILSYCMENFLDGRFHVIAIEHINYVTRLSQDEWDVAKQQASEIMVEAANRNWPVNRAQTVVSGLLPSHGSEFGEELWRLTAAKAQLAATGGAGEQFVVAYGTSMEAMVLGILSESERPLHFLEVTERLRERNGLPDRGRYVHAACGRYALLYGRGTFGLRKHFPLTEEEEDALVQEAVAIVNEGKSGRQWHCNELVEHLYANAVDFGGKLDPYILCIALQTSSALTYLGRMVWVRDTGEQMSAANRIDIRQAILSVIQEAGHPLYYKEIRERIISERGINDIFQIFDGGNLLRLGSGRWGLLDRDLGMSEATIAVVLDRIAVDLEHRGTGLHTSELLPFAESYAPRFESLGGGSVLLAVAARDQRFRSSAGQYLYLSKWEGPRRLQLGDAVRQILVERPGGASIQAVIVAASQLMGREIARDAVYASMRNIGAVWTEEAGCWSIPPDSSTIEEEGDLAPERSICS